MIFKRGSIYYYKFIWKGHQIYESTRQTNRRAAEQMESARKTGLAKAEVGIIERKPAPLFSDYCPRFLKWVESEKKEQPGTVKFYNDMVRSLLRYDPLAKTSLDRIDEALRDQFIEWRRTQTRLSVRRRAGNEVECVDTGKPLSVATINRELATLRRMLNLAADWKLIQAAPRIKLLPGERQCERILSPAEEETYLALAPPLLREFDTVMLETSARPDECRVLRWEFVHFEPAGAARYGYIHIAKGKSKNAKRNLPLTAGVKAVLEMRWEAAGRPAMGWVFANDTGKNPIHYDAIDSLHDRVMRRLPVEKRFRLYDLRHTALTRLGEAGANVFALQKIAGHADLKTTSRYVHPTPEHIEDAFARLEVYNRRKSEELTKGCKVQ